MIGYSDSITLDSHPGATITPPPTDGPALAPRSARVRSCGEDVKVTKKRPQLRGLRLPAPGVARGGGYSEDSAGGADASGAVCSASTRARLPT